MRRALVAVRFSAAEHDAPYGPESPAAEPWLWAIRGMGLIMGVVERADGVAGTLGG